MMRTNSNLLLALLLFSGTVPAACTLTSEIDRSEIEDDAAKTSTGGGDMGDMGGMGGEEMGGMGGDN